MAKPAVITKKIKHKKLFLRVRQNVLTYISFLICEVVN